MAWRLVQAQPPCSYAKFLVVGEARTGKTTFLKQLLAAYAQVGALLLLDCKQCMWQV